MNIEDFKNLIHDHRFDISKPLNQAFKHFVDRHVLDNLYNGQVKALELDVPIDLVAISKYNVRPTVKETEKDETNIQGLANNIMAMGGLLHRVQILLEVDWTKPDGNLFFGVLAGQRRYRAIKDYCQWPDIQCRLVNTSPDDAVVLSFEENLHQKPMTKERKTRFYKKISSTLGEDATCEKLGISKSTLKRYVKIADTLNPDLLPFLDETREDCISLEVANSLRTASSDFKEQAEIFERIKDLPNTQKTKVLKQLKDQIRSDKKDNENYEFNIDNYNIDELKVEAEQKTIETKENNKKRKNPWIHGPDQSIIPIEEKYEPQVFEYYTKLVNGQEDQVNVPFIFNPHDPDGNIVQIEPRFYESMWEHYQSLLK